MGLGIDVVHEDRIEPGQPQALQAVLDAAAHACARQVPVLDKGRDLDIAVLLPGGLRLGQQQPADLARQAQLGPRSLPKRLPHAPLRQAVPVVRRRVKAAAAVGPGRLHQGAGLLLRDRLEQIAQGRAAQTQAHRVGTRLEQSRRRWAWCSGHRRRGRLTCQCFDEFKH
jgi:hypothetical protein